VAVDAAGVDGEDDGSTAAGVAGSVVAVGAAADDESIDGAGTPAAGTTF